MLRQLTSRTINDMRFMARCLVRIALSFGLCFCAAAQAQTERLGRGGEWLSWTPVQRSAYVYSFTDGYMLGFSDACHLADQLFEIGKPHRLGDERHPTEVPSGRCLAHRGEFSQIKFDGEGHLVGVNEYADVITAFYEKHTTCQAFPFPFLLQVLGSKYLTANQLYDLAVKGGLKGYELRSREWCSGVSPQVPSR